jgi:NAD-dependent dihydropyrimidine dehydrogenase PreA subunit
MKENFMTDYIYYPEVLTLELDSSKCNNCGMCIKVCPHDVFTLKDKKVYIAKRDYCMECGACKINCPQKAILVNVSNMCGCAAGIIQGAIKGTAPSCGGSKDAGCC